MSPADRPNDQEQEAERYHRHIVVTYFLLLALFVVLEKRDISPLADTLATNFTFLICVVIAFHLQISDYERVAAVRATAAAESTTASDIKDAAAASEVEGTKEED